MKLPMAAAAIYLQRRIKDPPNSPTDPSVSKTCFCNASFFKIFICIIVLCYNNNTQHIHGAFNHSEAWDNWDNLERKLNIINFYFRAKEIKTQESDLPRVNYRNLEPTQVCQLQQCPVYRTISMLKVFLKVYNHN